MSKPIQQLSRGCPQTVAHPLGGGRKVKGGGEMRSPLGPGCAQPDSPTGEQ